MNAADAHAAYTSSPCDAIVRAYASRYASVIRDAAGITKKNTVIVHTGFKVSLF